jgi:hypothetical protein
MVSAFSAARKNKLDLSVGIALGSAVQIALFIAPVLVLASYLIGPIAMDLQFWRGAVAMTLVASVYRVSGDKHRPLGVVRRSLNHHGLHDFCDDALVVAARWSVPLCVLNSLDPCDHAEEPAITVTAIAVCLLLLWLAVYFALSE